MEPHVWTWRSYSVHLTLSPVSSGALDVVSVWVQLSFPLKGVELQVQIRPAHPGAGWVESFWGRGLTCNR